jgi:hypothetical protein
MWVTTGLGIIERIASRQNAKRIMKEKKIIIKCVWGWGGGNISEWNCREQDVLDHGLSNFSPCITVNPI